MMVTKARIYQRMVMTGFYSLDRDSPIIRQAGSVFDTARRSHLAGDPLDWEIALAAARSLSTWGATAPCIAAALLIPPLQNRFLSATELSEQVGPQPVELAQRLLAWWSAGHPPTGNQLDEEEQDKEFSFLLRSLLRQVYIDYPDFQFIKLLTAWHDAQLERIGDPYLAKLTLAVYIPLAEILCLWELRERWQKMSVPLAASRDKDIERSYQSICKLVEKNQWGTESEGLQVLLKKTRLERRGPANKAEKVWLVENRKKAEKLACFWYIRRLLVRRAREAGLALDPQRIQIRLHEPGNLYLRSLEGLSGYNELRARNSPEEILNQLWIMIFCDSEDDCYQLLGFLHSLGKPIDPRYSQRFDDYIAAPQPNGYRALHTALNFHPADHDQNADPNLSILVEARIMTPLMRRFNRWGVIEAFYHQPDKYLQNEKYRYAWWSQAQVDGLLERVNSRLPENARYKQFSQFIGSFELNTRSPHLYVFTPKGQIIIMKEGSTALDFAYEIHSELGNHAARIEVNRQPVNYDYRLRNGDMVQVHYDPRFSGPDFSWLGQVTSRRAHKIIRHQLTIAYQGQHEGRIAIQEALANTLNYYQDKKGFSLIITTRQLNAFLTRYARARSYPSLNDLYDAVQTSQKPGEILPSRIIQRLISNELAPALLDMNGLSLPFPRHRITLCDGCRPVPGEPIVGVGYVRSDSRRITVHHIHCKLRGTSAVEIPLRWAEKGAQDQEALVEFQILAWDRPQLLSDVLACIYETPNSYLYNVNASTQPDGTAVISLIASNPDRSVPVDILAQIEGNVRDVIRVQAGPVSPFHPSVIQARRPGQTRLSNPFFEHIVYTPSDFYDRERETHFIRTWLENSQALPWLILHGQRRVGKTSLGMYLTKTVFFKSRQVTPVFIDMRGRSGSSTREIARFLLSEICRSLNITCPAFSTDDNPIAWLRSGIDQAAAEKGTPRLLVILDEFDTLIDDPRCQSDPLLFRNIASILQLSPKVRWLLILQEATFRSELPPQLIAIVQQTNQVFIDRLEETEARRFIFETLIQGGIRLPWQQKDHRTAAPDPTHPLVERIYHLSGGYPYYVRQICFHLPFDDSQPGGARYISDRDLDHAVREVLLNGEVCFDHFTRYLKSTHRLILDQIAQLSDGHGEWVSFTRLSRALRRKSKRLSRDEIEQALGIMEYLTVIQRQERAEGLMIRIPVQIFAQWLRKQLISRAA